MSINIRPAVAKDFAAVARLLTVAHAAEGNEILETAETVKERSRDALIVVAESAGIIAATMTVAGAGSPYGPVASKGQMEVSRLAVDPIFQHRGIAAAMVRAVVQSCRNQGVQALVGVTLNSLSAAHRLYESVGATPATIPGTNARSYMLDLKEA